MTLLIAMVEDVVAVVMEELEDVVVVNGSAPRIKRSISDSCGPVTASSDAEVIASPKTMTVCSSLSSVFV